MPDSAGGVETLCGGGEPERSDSLRTFGEVVKAFRKRAGLTQEEFAPRVRYSLPTVASIEQGRRFPPGDFVDRAEEVLDAFGALRGAARHLSRQPGLASWFRQWARFEAEAVSLYTYECRVVPGLLQTEGYARAVSFSVPPLPAEEEMNDRIAARMARHALLATDRKPPTAFSFIVEQAVLERHTGGEEVTRELYDHLLSTVEQHWNVEFQLMPLRQPVHAGLDGPMQLAEAPDNRWFGYSEGQKNGRLITDRKEISVLHQRYAKMRSQALTPEDSLGLLKRMRGAL
ncbi:Scr1 family TA system antitoxin-like transcriptional regulator [Streptomyces olivaceus]|uniref:helix-turn-helix domain-containing protein n=1 Tax=Streptomyces TaxID=1883 RepID=UPI0006934B4D|nr:MULTISPECIES: helix-turn-helix transcriptional regulator [Streptomyces]MBF8173846.1 helix-turn-helix transcriptional regulator [Streptomyces olivaceus]MBZ6101195.1 helix-turn-helix transcriptional regulator [Streptomyces olivaceus]MBZ6139910.1 helix-turn-helix transcriptional regulator [Streptomyces olivaceus]MBZ6166185.1 helix-turn-helix transcriptional regulator [Streptomyces olivaceus]MBZ6199999.1 helix-turn-helix transcriptional regulator [Streptomyces olivaceus]